MYNPNDRKIHTVSYNYCTCEEDNFPFRTRLEWTSRNLDLPLDFQPSAAAFVNNEEWAKYGYTDDQELEVSTQLAGDHPEKWDSVFDTPEGLKDSSTHLPLHTDSGGVPTPSPIEVLDTDPGVAMDPPPLMWRKPPT